MVTIDVHVPLRLAGLPSAFDVFVPECLRETAQIWHEDMLPDHFTDEAYSQYGYQERTEEWNRRKGTTEPLRGMAEMQGRPNSLQRMATSPSLTQITSQGRSARLRMRVPRYAKAGTGRAETEPELTTVTDEERRVLAGVLADRLAKKLGAF